MFRSFVAESSSESLMASMLRAWIADSSHLGPSGPQHRTRVTWNAVAILQVAILGKSLESIFGLEHSALLEL